jgi:hypothetical protein
MTMIGDGGSLNGPSRLGASQNTDTGGEIANTTCGAVLGQTRFRCDREHGHSGQHRSYFEQIDEPVFWSERTIRMDMRTGQIYETIEEAKAAGVPDEFLVSGTREALDGLKKRLKFRKGAFKTIQNADDKER